MGGTCVHACGFCFPIREGSRPFLHQGLPEWTPGRTEGASQVQGRAEAPWRRAGSKARGGFQVYLATGPAPCSLRPWTGPPGPLRPGTTSLRRRCLQEPGAVPVCTHRPCASEPPPARPAAALTVLLPPQDFWGDVIRGSTERAGCVARAQAFLWGQVCYQEGREAAVTPHWRGDVSQRKPAWDREGAGGASAPGSRGARVGTSAAGASPRDHVLALHMP